MFKNYTCYHSKVGRWCLPNVNIMHPAEIPTMNFSIKTNSTGMRDNRDFNIEKNSKFRISMYGDSFTFGNGVPVEKRFSNQLEEMTENLEILNFGHSGSGTDHQYLIYKHIGSKFETDMVLFLPHVSNITRNKLKYYLRQERNGKIFFAPKPYFEFKQDSLFLRNSQVPKKMIREGPIFDLLSSPEYYYKYYRTGWKGKSKDFFNLKNLYDLIRKTRFKYILTRAFGNQPFPQYDSPNNSYWLLMKEIITKWSSESNSVFILVPLPSWNHVFCPELADSYRTRFKELADTNSNIKLIDIFPYFSNKTFLESIKLFVSPQDVHYSGIGNALVSKALKIELNKLEYIGLR